MEQMLTPDGTTLVSTQAQDKSNLMLLDVCGGAEKFCYWGHISTIS